MKYKSIDLRFKDKDNTDFLLNAKLVGVQERIGHRNSWTFCQ